jgi:hypothetical protein
MIAPPPGTVNGGGPTGSNAPQTLPG